MARVVLVGAGEGGPALFRLVRFWSRRWARGVLSDFAEDASLVQHVLTVDAVSCSGSGVTVNEVARQLGLDHSGASRMVAAAAAKGFVERTRAASDARRSVLRLTDEGHALLEASHRWQRQTFLELTAAWGEEEREQFAGYLRRLATEVGA